MCVLIALSSCKSDDTPSPSDPREQFKGSWLCKENSRLHGKSTFTVEIKTDTSVNKKIYIYNFYNIGGREFVYGIADDYSVSIPSQLALGNLRINGNGTKLNNTINWIYYINDGADLDTVSAIFSKQ